MRPRQGGPRIAPPKATSTLTWHALQQCTSRSPMPPWVATAPRLSSLINGRTTERIHVALRCRSNLKTAFTHLRVRSASTHVSPTAINLRPNIPPRNKELHDALSALSGAAETYVNISRLQLALAGLTAQDAVTRVAGRTDESESGRMRADPEHSSWFERSSECAATGATTPRRPLGSRGAMGEGASEGWCQWRESCALEVSANRTLSLLQQLLTKIPGTEKRLIPPPQPRCTESCPYLHESCGHIISKSSSRP
jgi:hypothetical protein